MQIILATKRNPICDLAVKYAKQCEYMRVERMTEQSDGMENTFPCTCSELPGFPRAETIRCPQCEHVQVAQIHFDDRMPFPAYVHDCEACGYTIMESEWERVPNVGVRRT